jgi:hypothetical protein
MIWPAGRSRGFVVFILASVFLLGVALIAQISAGSYGRRYGHLVSRSGTSMRALGLLDHNGILELTGAHFNGNRVSRMIVRTKKDAEMLNIQVPEMACAH